MQATTEDYQQQLSELTPPGPVWNRTDGSVFMKLLLAMADELARVHNRALDLIEEADPRTTFELLPDWERAFGLPEACGVLPDTLEERRNALVEKITRRGGQSPQYYIDVAALLGFTVTITEFDHFTVGSQVNDPIYDEEWNFVWQVNGPSETVRAFVVNSGVSEPLADWGNDLLECVITRLKPAHTYVQFAYG